jgi:ectoine hydroxylase-related dioxygenase (phytanoyl-CoA dioxygenase family)
MSLPLFRDITTRIIGAEEVSIFRSMFFNKPAADPGVSEGGVVINWHQDGNPATAAGSAYHGETGQRISGWGLDIDPRVTIWTALDECTVANGALQIVQGSHRFPISSVGDQVDDI